MPCEQHIFLSDHIFIVHSVDVKESSMEFSAMYMSNLNGAGEGSLLFADRSKVMLMDVDLFSNKGFFHIIVLDNTISLVSRLKITDLKITGMIIALYNVKRATMTDFDFARVDCHRFFYFLAWIDISEVALRNVSIKNSKTPKAFECSETILEMTNINITGTEIEREIFFQTRSQLILKSLQIETCTFELLLKTGSRSSVTISNSNLSNSNSTYIFYLLGGLMQVTNFSVTNCIINEQVIFINLGTELNITSMKLSKSIIGKAFCYGLHRSKIAINQLQVSNITLENLFLLYETNLTISQLDLTNVKFQYMLQERVTTLSSFVVLKNSNVSLKNVDIKNCNMDAYLFFVKNSKIIVNKTNVRNSEFSRLFELSKSSTFLIDIQAIGNSATRSTKLIKATSSSIFISNMINDFDELNSNDNLVYVAFSNVNFNNVKLRVQSSAFLQFLVFKWNFVNDSIESDLKNFTIQCPKNFNAMLDDRSLSF